MASIKIYDLNVAGTSLFQDRESYLDELNDSDLAIVKGGISPTYLFTSGLVIGALASVIITKGFK